MSVLRWSRPITTRRCTASICCANRNPANKVRPDMKPADVCLAVTVAVIWGVGFIASRIALDEFSPPLMTTLRFVFAALPCLFVPRPKVSWSMLSAISFTLFLGQFLAQAYGIGHGVPVGLSSVIVQSQALFTIGLAAILFRAVPLSVLTLVIDGPQATGQALWHMSLTSFVAMVWIGGISTCIAYWLWGRLLRDYPAAQVVPFALLVPFVGSAASSIVFGEHFGPLRLAGMVTVIGGIAVMLLARRPKALPKTASEPVLPEIA